MKFVHPSGSRPLDGYTLKRGIGVGGFGEVYFAVSDAGKEVALKRIQRHLDVEIRGVSQCLNLKHANLLALYDIKYDAQGDAWVLMEYVAGGSLRDVIEQFPAGLPADVVRHWLRGMLLGVAYLHDHGIVHRDLKPGNIFGDQGVVKVGDYGLSKFISCSRRSGHTESVGTFHYMAPEIGRGSYGKEIDVYALGVILYEMLTGRVPFDGESSQEIIMKHLTASPDLAPLPPEYRELVRRALLKDPTRRYADAAEMLAALGETPLPGATSSGATSSGATAPCVTAELVHEPPPDIVAAVPIASGSPHVTGSPVKSGEPVAAFVGAQWRTLRTWWRQETPSAQAGWLLAAMLVALFGGLPLLPLIVGVGGLYLIYFAIYSLCDAFSPLPAATSPVALPAPQPASPTPIARAVGAQPARSSDASGRHSHPTTPANAPPQRGAAALRTALRLRPRAEQAGEFLTSLLSSAFVVAVVSLVAMLTAGRSFDLTLETAIVYAWFSLTALAGVWSVQTLGKIWEARSGDAVRRRFVLLVVGLLVGAFSYALSRFLIVSLNDSWPVRPLSPMGGGSHFYDSSGRPALAGFLAYFGAIFMTSSWWTQVDPLRESRFSLWTVVSCATIAWLFQMVWSFWQPWGILTFATISIALQLSSPWISPAERRSLVRLP